MKKIFFMLLCAASVVLVSCNKNEQNDPTDPGQTTEYDPEGQADVEIRFYTCDSLLMYFDIESIVDSLNPTLDCSKYTKVLIDTLGADAAYWKTVTDPFTDYKGSTRKRIPANQTYALVLPLKIKAGQHKFYLNYKRNSKDYGNLEKLSYGYGNKFSTSDKKVELAEYSSDAITAIGVKIDKLKNNVTTKTSTRPLAFTMKVRK